MKIYKITKASEYLGMSINTLKMLAINGRIKSFKTTGKRRFRQEDLDAYMGELRKNQGGIMFLYVEMFDGWTAFHESQYGCSHPTGCRRVVKLELTPEQVEQIRPKKTGNNGKTEMFESVNPICIQNT